MGMQLLETISVGAGGATSLTFADIPQDGLDLVLRISTRAGSGISAQSTMSLNSSTANNGDFYLVGLNGTRIAFSGLNTQRIYFTSGASATANSFGVAEVYISNYAGSGRKNVIVDGGSKSNATSDVYTYLSALNYIQPAITTLKLQTAGNYLQYSTASLYKVTAD